MGKIKDLICFPFIKIKNYFVRIYSVCGLKFILFLIISQLLIKGLLYSISNSVLLPIFKGMGVEPTALQLFMTITASPWAFKSVFGILSDLFSIRGYHKKYWIVQGIVVGLIGASFTFVSHTTTILVLCFTAINYEMSIIDLLTESKYAELIRENPDSSSDIVTFTNSLQTIGGLFGISIVGPLSDLKMFWIVFIIIVILAFSPLIPTLVGFLPEKKNREEPIRFMSVDKELFLKYRSVIIVVMFSGVSSIIVAILAMFDIKTLTIISAFFLLVASIVGAYMSFPRVIAHVALYLSVTKIAKPSMATALDFFFTADAECFPGGPNFSFKYYIMYTGIISACFALFAIWLYQIWLSGWRIRSVLIFTTCLDAFGGLSDFLIVTRFNLTLGINDHVFYIFGQAILETIVNILYWIPSSILISKVCPKGIEAITYAFLASVSNFSTMVSGLLGAIIFNSAGVKKCNFDNLWWLILCFHILSPLVISIPISFIIPNQSQDSEMIDADDNVTNEIRIIKEKMDEDVELSTFSNESDLDFEFDFELNLSD